MKRLTNKRIVLGISGGIAAYKSCELTRELVKHGADVRVVMTASAMEFVTPLTLQALSGNPVRTSLLDPEGEAGMGHIELARWADLVLIAPASANVLARLASGLSDDLLTTLCLATEAPIAVAPAMNQAMWRDPTTQANLETLRTLRDERLVVMGPDAGEQACGDVGLGRMLEPYDIAKRCADCFISGVLDGCSVVITAGPTREAMDPVRYISNHSSGKMGYALAEAARDAGATVTLISGPTALACPDRVQRIDVTSALDMLAASESALPCDVFIATAAVADYRPADVSTQKIKKSDDDITLTLVKNPDIVAHIARHAKRPFTVGFAAETQHVEQYAKEKRVRKGLDMIVANDVSTVDAGFNSDNNAATVFWQDSEHSLCLMSKTALAIKLVDLIAKRYHTFLNSDSKGHHDAASSS